MIQIDRQKIYESHGYKFKNFVCLTDDEKQMILRWRNHEKVRNMMVNKDIISLENHLNFIESLKDRDDCFYWLVINPVDMYVGVLDVIHVDMGKDQGEIGYYLNQDAIGEGFDFMIECLFFVYNQLSLGNNIATINIKNKDILLFNKFLSATFEGKKEINGEIFYFNEHGNGNYILDHYSELNIADYARFVRMNKNNPHLYDI